MKYDIPTYGNYHEGETIKMAQGYTAQVCIIHDDSMGEPWKEHDGHGIVSDWTTRDKGAGEMVLNVDRSSKRFYDFAATVKKARAEGWDAAPYGGTKGERAHRAAMADFERMRAWCNDEWQWIGVAVTVFHKGEQVAQDSLWGIESDGYYWKDVAREMIDDAIAGHKAERKERKHWESRDVQTIAA